MNELKSIDEKLRQFAIENNATIHTSSAMSDDMDERRIFWFDNLIGKGIIICPEYELLNFKGNSILWNVWNIAWLLDENYMGEFVPFWKKYLLKKVPFTKIEKAIDSLLNQSYNNLKKINVSNLKE